MKKTGAGLEISKNISKFLFTLNKGVADCHSVEEACLIFEDYLKHSNLVLLSVKFCDIEGKFPVLRPFGKYSSVISNLSAEMRDVGGCPITKEAIRNLAPFDAIHINSKAYSDFMSARFLDELKKMGHKHIAAVPMLVGQGLMLVTIGLGDRPFTGRFREEIIMDTCNFGILMAQKFGNVADIFQSKVLTPNQAQALFLYASGFTIRQISHIFQLSEVTINLLLKGASRKLGAKNLAEATARALGRGEISNLYGV